MTYESYRMQCAASMVAWLQLETQPWSPQTVTIVPTLETELEKVTGTLVNVVVGPRWKGVEQRFTGECRLTIFIAIQRKLQSQDDLGKLREIDLCLKLVEQIEDALLRPDNRTFGDWLLTELDAEGEEREPFSDGYIRHVRSFTELIPCRMLRGA